MIEHHPFGDFVPRGAKYLLLGSFAGRKIPGYDWFYANKRNHFWPILETVYGVSVPTKRDRQKLLAGLGMAISDVVLSCERAANSNLDVNLKNMTFNAKAIKRILRENKIQKIFFSSRFAESLFRRNLKDLIAEFPEVELVTLPSPSPRYAAMSKKEKIKRYKELLPAM